MPWGKPTGKQELPFYASFGMKSCVFLDALQI